MCGAGAAPWSVSLTLTRKRGNNADCTRYVWGDTVWKAKTQCESLDYLFQLAVKMYQLGLDPAGAITPVEA